MDYLTNYYRNTKKYNKGNFAKWQDLNLSRSHLPNVYPSLDKTAIMILIFQRNTILNLLLHRDMRKKIKILV